MTGDLQGVRALVTGGSRGLGRAVAEAYGARGARVVVTATALPNLEGVLSTFAERGWEAHGVVMDLTAAGSVEAGVHEAIRLLGAVDVLVNNAGLLGVRAPLADYPLDTWERVMTATTTGVLRTVQATLPAMGPGGAIINVTSGAAGRPGWGAYAVSRMALDGITRVLRHELASGGIRCVGVNPGPARTAMRAAAYPQEDPASVPDPAALVGPFVAIAAGDDPGEHVEAVEWPR